MPQTDELHQLIRHLSGPEKRYFKQEALKNNGGKAPNYLKLFEVYAKMEVYDKEKLRSLSYIKHPSESKKFLFQKVLEHIRNFEKKHLYHLQLKEMITDIRFLRKRRIWKYCNKYIRKAKKLAAELDDQSSILEILMEERMLLLNSLQEGYEDQLNSLEDEYGKAIKNLKTDNELETLFNQLYVILKKKAHPDSSDLEIIHSNQHLQLLSKTPESYSGKALRKYYKTRGMLAWLQKDYKTTLQMYQRVNGWWKNYEKLAKEYQNQFLSDVLNLLAAVFREQDWPLMERLLQKLKKIKPNSPYDQKYHFYTVHLYELLYTLNTANFENATILSIGIKRGIKRYQITGRDYYILMINLAQVHFFKGDYKACANTLDPLTRGDLLLRKDVRALAHIIQMVNLYSLNDLEGLDALNRRSALTFKKLKLPDNGFEYLVMKKFNEFQMADPTKKRKLYRSFYKILQQKKDNPIEQHTYGLDNIYFWLKSRIERRPLNLVYKESLKKVSG